MSLIAAIFIALLMLPVTPAMAQAPELPIGSIQGPGGESPYLNRFVTVRGVVVGLYEDRNTRGDVYYSLFVQSEAGDADGDPATSDGIAVFLGREPRALALGQRVVVAGKVTEFYGLTEIDDNGLILTPEEPGMLPDPVILQPPADIEEAATYFEALEGMRVAFPGEVIVAGPTHEGCGFAVVDAAFADELPLLRRAPGDPTGRAVPILYPSDLNCDDIPQVKSGDRLGGVAGALTYNFDQFKVVIDTAAQLSIDVAQLRPLEPLPALSPSQVSLASINAEDYFDAVRDMVEVDEPVATADELAARQAKFVHLLARALACPTLVAFQEIENEALLADLAAALAGPCGFRYTVTHRPSPDARGIDNALLSDPRRVAVNDVALRQTCSPAPTEVHDSSLTCEVGQFPLFGRPPLEVAMTIDNLAYFVYVNHFKSKRGGEIDTGLERIQQAVYLNQLAAEQLAVDPGARIVVVGDFNDTDRSPAMALLTDQAQGGVLINALESVPAAQRYTFNFGGVAELIDTALLSPALVPEIGLATILHSNTDYPVGWRLDASPQRIAYRTTDHDVPVIVLGQWPATPTPPPTPSPTLLRPAQTPQSPDTPDAPPATETQPPPSALAVTAEATPTTLPVVRAGTTREALPVLGLGILAGVLLLAGLIIARRAAGR